MSCGRNAFSLCARKLTKSWPVAILDSKIGRLSNLDETRRLGILPDSWKRIKFNMSRQLVSTLLVASTITLLYYLAFRQTTAADEHCLFVAWFQLDNNNNNLKLCRKVLMVAAISMQHKNSQNKWTPRLKSSPTRVQTGESACNNCTNWCRPAVNTRRRRLYMKGARNTISSAVSPSCVTSTASDIKGIQQNDFSSLAA